MATTFLQLTNELLRELNEVPMSSGNFTNAIGIQQHAKDCINRAYSDIVTEEPKWPFLAVAESGTVDPMYGNVSVDTTAGTRWYELKESSSSWADDYAAIDWENFYITTVGVAGETAPYVNKNLRFISTETWKDFKRTQENNDDADTQNWGEPNAVIRSPDGRNFGLSPIPKKEYKVWFFAWRQPVKLNLYSDEVVFPDMYTNVVIAKARYYMWQFKENPQSASFAMDDYKKGLRSMRENLLDPPVSYIKDDRIRFV
jgi:hypothetical protein